MHNWEVIMEWHSWSLSKVYECNIILLILMVILTLEDIKMTTRSYTTTDSSNIFLVSSLTHHNTFNLGVTPHLALMLYTQFPWILALKTAEMGSLLNCSKTIVFITSWLRGMNGVRRKKLCCVRGRFFMDTFWEVAFDVLRDDMLTLSTFALNLKTNVLEK